MSDRASIAACRRPRPGALGRAIAQALVWALVCAGAPILAEDIEESTAPSQAPDPMDDPALPWLDEVRAQRRAVEERRKAAREAIDARRRLSDPWGAAQKDAREDDLRRRRQAHLERMEQEREMIRGQAPAQPPAPWPAIPDPPPPPGPAAGDNPLGPAYPTPPPAPFAPPGWDNYWYYRGY